MIHVTPAVLAVATGDSTTASTAVLAGEPPVSQSIVSITPIPSCRDQSWRHDGDRECGSPL